MRNLLSGGSTAYITHMAVGVGSAALSGNQTTLGSEVVRNAVDTADDTSSYETTLTLYLTSVQATGLTLNEVGTFPISSGGSVFTRNNVSGLSKTADIEVYFDHKIIFAEG